MKMKDTKNSKFRMNLLVPKQNLKSINSQLKDLKIKLAKKREKSIDLTQNSKIRKSYKKILTENKEKVKSLKRNWQKELLVNKY